MCTIVRGKQRHGLIGDFGKGASASNLGMRTHRNQTWAMPSLRGNPDKPEADGVYLSYCPKNDHDNTAHKVSSTRIHMSSSMLTKHRRPRRNTLLFHQLIARLPPKHASLGFWYEFTGTRSTGTRMTLRLMLCFVELPKLPSS